MDYEFHIRYFEREVAHLREMQSLMRAHQETHDQGPNAAVSRFERIEGYLERTEANLAALSEKFNGLIQALAREHRNGG